MEDLNQGEIYLIRNLVNDKVYIGQAHKFVSKNKLKWGTKGRWKSHLREAISGINDHCLLLNQAIRKYGGNNFSVKKLCDCIIEELDIKEILFIDKYNSLSPNGYNLNTGGSKGKDSDETRIKKQSSRIGLKHSEETRISISLGQIGCHRNPDDANLPPFVCAKRTNKIITGYFINKFYTNINLTSYVTYCYKTLDETILKLEELKITYPDVWRLYIDYKNKKINSKIVDKVKQNLPKNIYPIIKDCKIFGYFVDDLFDNKNNPIPRKEFVGNTNKWNLDQAKKYIEQIKHLISNKIDILDWSNIESVSKKINKNGTDVKYLPKYINLVNSKNEKIGYCVNGIIIKKNDGSSIKYFKKFTRKSLTMDQKYELAISHLEEIKIANNIL